MTEQCPHGCDSKSQGGDPSAEYQSWDCGSYRWKTNLHQSAACRALCQDARIRELQATLNTVQTNLMAICNAGDSDTMEAIALQLSGVVATAMAQRGKAEACHTFI